MSRSNFDFMKLYHQVSKPEQIVNNNVYYIDSTTFPGPSLLVAHGQKNITKEDRMVPVKVIDRSIIEFLDERIVGHTCDGRLKKSNGWWLNVDKYPSYFYIKINDDFNKVTVKKGELKGKKGTIVSKLDKHTIVNFGKDVGGCSVDGAYPKGNCLIIEDSYLHFSKGATKKLRKEEAEKTGYKNISNKGRLFSLQNYKDYHVLGWKVILVSHTHDESCDNPVWGGEYGQTFGRIIGIYPSEALPLNVEWMHMVGPNTENIYNYSDLGIFLEDVPLGTLLRSPSENIWRSMHNNEHSSIEHNFKPSTIRYDPDMEVRANYDNSLTPAEQVVPESQPDNLLRIGNKVIHTSQIETTEPRVGIITTIEGHLVTVDWGGARHNHDFNLLIKYQGSVEEQANISNTQFCIGDIVHHKAAGVPPRLARIVKVRGSSVVIEWEDGGGRSTGFPIDELVKLPTSAA